MVKSLRTVLLVEEDVSSREALAAALRQEIGCVVLEASSSGDALETIENREVCLLLASCAPGRDGVALLAKVRSLDPQIVTIASFPHGQRGLVKEALQAGALNCVFTPYDPTEGVIAVAKGLRYYDLVVHQEKRGPKIRKSESFFGMVGNSLVLRQLFDTIEKVAADGISTVLLRGESGTGKELVARAIHALSERSGKNFVPLNCAAIPENLLESELFGYVKGAFTGANQAKIGRIQYAEGGTLFLDEIGDMRPDLQAKLLRVLQEKEFEPVGAVKPIPVNVRVVAATHRDLEKAVETGQFREDLYYRLAVIPLQLPPLRAHLEDLPLLVDKFIQVFSREHRQALAGFTPAAMAALQAYPWPGNVRELENLVQQMSVLHGGVLIDVHQLPEKITGRPPAPSLPAGATLPVAPPAPDEVWTAEAIDFNALVGAYEERLILLALAKAGGNKKEAARLLNLKRTTLSEKIKKRNLEGAAAES